MIKQALLATLSALIALAAPQIASAKEGKGRCHELVAAKDKKDRPCDGLKGEERNKCCKDTGTCNRPV